MDEHAATGVLVIKHQEEAHTSGAVGKSMEGVDTPAFRAEQ